MQMRRSILVINHSSALAAPRWRFWRANDNNSSGNIATAYLNNLNDGDAVIAYCTHETQGRRPHLD